jgi:tol-pal system protein YbgF
LAAGLLLALSAWSGAAQDLPPDEDAPAGQPEPKPAPAAKPQGGDSVAARLGRLEEKVQSLQVMIGTLQSFSGNKAAASVSVEAPRAVSPAQGDLGPRLDALETQISALTSHVEQIGRQMSALEAKLSALQSAPPPLRQGEAPAPPADTATASVGASDAEAGGPGVPRWYGPKPGSDEVAALLENDAASDVAPAGDSGADNAPRNLTAALSGAEVQTLYQRGYAALLQKDYGGAEVAFRQLVESYPSDALAGDAQYWLGETYYVRGQYKNAADTFLKGYQKYKSGQKAPDTLLKLGMALAELGQKDAACSTFGELKTKYPAAPAHIADEANAWRNKTGC